VNWDTRITGRLLSAWWRGSPSRGLHRATVKIVVLPLSAKAGTADATVCNPPSWPSIDDSRYNCGPRCTRPSTRARCSDASQWEQCEGRFPDGSSMPEAARSWLPPRAGLTSLRVELTTSGCSRERWRWAGSGQLG